MANRIISIIIITVSAAVGLSANCIVGNCINGSGTKQSTAGDRWVGKFVNAQLEGEGEWISNQGDYYRGAFRNGVMHGRGMLRYKSGDVYIGEFAEGAFDGKGRYKYANGDQYFGYWQMGAMHGAGTYSYANGEQLKGTYEHGKLVEEPTLKIKQNNVGQVAEAYTAPPAGELASVTKDCTSKYCDGIRGIYKYGDGSRYIGDFKAGAPDGVGRCEYINGDVYEGGWKYHSPHGKGIMHFASGQKYAAMWDHGHPKEQLLDDLDFTSPEKTSPNAFNERVDIYALVVGVATYAHMPSLKYTDDDAYQVYAFLKSPEGGAVPEDKVKVLIDDSATKSNILLAMDELFSKADANDVVFLYISGHGLEGSFIPSDFNGYSNNIPYTEITKIIDKSEAKSKICIADACHSGSLVTAKTPFQASLDDYYQVLGQSAGGTALMMSSAASEVSLEYSGLRQGVFSHYLLKGMKGGADTNGDKIVNVSELFAYISKGVASYTAQKQTPVLTGTYDPQMPVAMIR